MRRHEPWRTTNNTNIPRCANIQARAVRCGQPSIHDITPAMRRQFSFHNFVFARQTKQSVSQFLPFGHGEAKPEKERCLASAGGVPGIEQIMRDLSLRHGGQLGVRQFHFLNRRTVEQKAAGASIPKWQIEKPRGIPALRRKFVYSPFVTRKFLNCHGSVGSKSGLL